MKTNELFKKLNEDGCVHIPSFFNEKDCLNMVRNYQNTIKSNADFEYLRVKSFKPEKHQYSRDGFVINPLLNVHDSPCESFSVKIRQFLQSEKLKSIVNQSMGEPAALVQSMYFESNRGTEEHFDGDLFDTESGGQLLGVWVALEEINDENGAFFYYPKSCFLKDKERFGDATAKKFTEYLACSALKFQNYKTNVTENLLEIYKRGKKLLNEIKDDAKLSRVSHHYMPGDIVIFNSRILHGSFRPTKYTKTRNSLSAHFVPLSSRLVRHGSVVEELTYKKEGGLIYKTAS